MSRGIIVIGIIHEKGRIDFVDRWIVLGSVLAVPGLGVPPPSSLSSSRFIIRRYTESLVQV